MALTSAADAFAWRSARRMALAVASRQVCGCCSLAPGGQIGKQVIFLRRRGDDFAVARVHDEDLGGLGAAINAE